MLVVAGVVNYIDRATLAVANPLIRQDLGLSIADMGYLLSAFLWSYAFAQLPTGAMVDKLGPRILLTLGLSLWSLAQFLGGLVRGFGEFFGARMLARHRRGAAIPDLRARGAGLVQPAGPRPGDGHLQLRVVAGHGYRRSAADLPDAGVRLARDVHAHGRRRGLWWRRCGIFIYRDPTGVALTAEENTYRTQGDPPGSSGRRSRSASGSCCSASGPPGA